MPEASNSAHAINSVSFDGALLALLCLSTALMLVLAWLVHLLYSSIQYGHAPSLFTRTAERPSFFRVAYRKILRNIFPFGLVFKKKYDSDTSRLMKEILAGIPRSPVISSGSDHGTSEAGDTAGYVSEKSYEGDDGRLEIPAFLRRANFQNDGYGDLPYGASKRARASDGQASDEVSIFLSNFTFDVAVRTIVEGGSDQRQLVYVPVEIHLRDGLRGYSIVDAVDDFCESLGLIRAFEAPAISGSWIKRIFFRTSALASPERVAKTVSLAESALRTAIVDAPAAVAMKDQAEAAAILLRAIGESDAQIQLGNLHLVRAKREDGSAMIVCRTLSHDEISQLRIAVNHAGPYLEKAQYLTDLEAAHRGQQSLSDARRD